jgi:recombinational DNA repair protein RecT
MKWFSILSTPREQRFYRWQYWMIVFNDEANMWEPLTDSIEFDTSVTKEIAKAAIIDATKHLRVYSKESIRVYKHTKHSYFTYNGHS